MSEIIVIWIICCVLLLAGGWLLFGAPALVLANAGSGRMAIVPPAEQIMADCGQASRIADGACNVQVQEYDTLAMVSQFALVCIVGLCGIGGIVFAIGCITLN